MARGQGSVEECASGELAKKQAFVPLGGQVPPAIMQLTGPNQYSVSGKRSSMPDFSYLVLH